MINNVLQQPVELCQITIKDEMFQDKTRDNCCFWVDQTTSAPYLAMHGYRKTSIDYELTFLVK